MAAPLPLPAGRNAAVVRRSRSPAGPGLSPPPPGCQSPAAGDWSAAPGTSAPHRERGETVTGGASPAAAAPSEEPPPPRAVTPSPLGAAPPWRRSRRGKSGNAARRRFLGGRPSPRSWGWLHSFPRGAAGWGPGPEPARGEGQALRGAGGQVSPRAGWFGRRLEGGQVAGC